MRPSPARAWSRSLIRRLCRTWLACGGLSSTTSPFRRSGGANPFIDAFSGWPTWQPRRSRCLSYSICWGTTTRRAVALAGTPVVILLFKLAGLYDRDELRLVHSTLDEAPLLLQLTGLFTLCVTILEPILLDGTLGSDQIAALWIVSFAAILCGRVLARWLAGRIAPAERCLVIGEPELAERVRAKLGASRARAVVVASLPLAGEDIDGAGKSRERA